MKMTPFDAHTTEVCSVSSNESSTSPSSAGSYVHNPYGEVSNREEVHRTAGGKKEEPKAVVMVHPLEPKGAGKKAGNAPSPCMLLVQFKFGRVAYFNSTKRLEIGTYVVVQADRGQDLGMVCGYGEGTETNGKGAVMKIVKKATQKQVTKWVELLPKREQDAVATMQSMIDKHNIPLQIVHAEYQFDCKKLTFHFVSPDALPNFRSVLPEAFSKWKCRIWFARYSRMAIDSECRRKLAEM